MTLLPKTYTHFCTKCNKPYEDTIKTKAFFGDILCSKCSDEKKDELQTMIKNWALNQNDSTIKFVPVHPQLTNQSEILYLELRGDDLEMIKYIKQNCSIENEKAYSWLCYLENEIKLKIERMK